MGSLVRFVTSKNSNLPICDHLSVQPSAIPCTPIKLSSLVVFIMLWNGGTGPIQGLRDDTWEVCRLLVAHVSLTHDAPSVSFSEYASSSVPLVVSALPSR